MIDLNWIASQPKPVAIHCPTYHDIMTVLCDINERRTCKQSEEEIIREADYIWGEHGEESCVRIKVLDSGHFDVWRHDYDFYFYHPKYILKSISEIKAMTTDLGEIEMCGDLSVLFGQEAMHG